MFLPNLEGDIALQCATGTSYVDRPCGCSSRNGSNDLCSGDDLKGRRSAVEGDTGGAFQIRAQNKYLRTYFSRVRQGSDKWGQTHTKTEYRSHSRAGPVDRGCPVEVAVGCLNQACPR